MKYVFEIIAFLIVEIILLFVGILLCIWHFENRFMFDTWYTYWTRTKLKMITIKKRKEYI